MAPPDTKEDAKESSDGDVPMAPPNTNEDAKGSSNGDRAKTKAPKAAAPSKGLPKIPPPMPHGASFKVVETGGQGDCAYTSVATALAKLGRSDAKPADLQPAGVCKVTCAVRPPSGLEDTPRTMGALCPPPASQTALALTVFMLTPPPFSPWQKL